MTPPSQNPPRLSLAPKHMVTYPRFLWRAALDATEGSPAFYAWMTLLTAIAGLGVYAWLQQAQHGMSVTNLTDQVSWGLYIANFTFVAGIAVGGVMMMIPAYIYKEEDMGDVVILGQLLVISAVVMALLLVTVDLGRPDRFWHLIPGIGRFNFPFSMLTWDVIILNGYLLINLHVCGYLIYMRWLGRTPNPRWYVPFALMSVLWGLSMPTALLYAGLGGRPFWNSALLAPRFLASSFIAGPALIVLTLQLVERLTGYSVPPGAVKRLVAIVRVTTVVNLFMLGSEIFTEFYSGGEHTASAHYLFRGLDGHYELVPWIWSAITLNVGAVAILLSPLSDRRPWLNVALGMTFIGVWIEKGMGLVIPAFVPSTLHQMMPYLPNATEWAVVVGVWAVGLMVYTVAVKFTVHTLAGSEHWSQAPPRTTTS